MNDDPLGLMADKKPDAQGSDDPLGLMGDSQPASSQPPQQKGFNLGQFVHKYVRPVLEIGGGVTGGVLAAPGNVIAPGVSEALGVAGGYMAGRQGANALEEATGYKTPSTIGQAAANAAKDVPSALIQGVSGPATNAAMQGAGRALSKYAKPVYESAMKIPPSISKKVRDRAIETGLDYKVPVSEEGLNQVTGKIEGLNTEIADAIDAVTTMQKTANEMNKKLGYKTFDENMIDMKAVTSRLDSLKQFYKDSAPNYKPYIEAIDQYKQDIIKSRGKEMFADAAQKLKQGIYALHRKHYGELKGLDIEMDKSVARGLKEELVNKYPELQNLNAEDSALINLQGFLERSVNRIRNYDIVKLGDQIMTTTGGVVGGAPGAAVLGTAKHVLGTPAFKSKLAFALAKGSRVGGTPLLDKEAQALAYGASKIFDNVTEDNNPPPNGGVVKGASKTGFLKFPSLVSEAEAGTLSDYAKGNTSARQRALQEAAGEGTQSFDIPRASVASDSGPGISSQEAEAKADRMIAEMERTKRSQSAPAKRAHIPVTQFIFHGADGDEIRYKDKQGKVYKEDPND